MTDCDLVIQKYMILCYTSVMLFVTVTVTCDFCHALLFYLSSNLK